MSEIKKKRWKMPNSNSTGHIAFDDSGDKAYIAYHPISGFLAHDYETGSIIKTRTMEHMLKVLEVLHSKQ